MALSVGSGGFLDPFKQSVTNFSNGVDSIQNDVAISSLSDRDYNAMREDTAYQRLRNDLEAAGLNKWLAVNGSASPSSQAISQTSEGMSRARELGFKYYQLYADLLKFGEKQVQQGAQKSMDQVIDILKLGLGLSFGNL